MKLIVFLLTVGALRHFGWAQVPFQYAGLASKGLGAFSILCLLLVIWFQSRKTKLLAAVLLWWSVEEFQVVVCTSLYAWRPWPIPAGHAMCSALVGLDLGSFSLIVVAVIAVAIAWSK